MIAHFADLQLGFDYAPHGRKEWRRQDTLKCFTAALQEIIKRQCETVLFVGDIFHSASPKRRDLRDFRIGLSNLSSSLPDKSRIVVVSGNHDTPKASGDIHPLQLFEDIPKVTCVYSERTSLLSSEGKLITAIPWIWGEPVEPLTGDGEGILAVHAPVVDYLPEAAQQSQVRVADPEWANRFRYVALGDIHQRIEVRDNMVFPGSLEHTSFGDSQAVCGGVFVDVSTSSPTLEWWDSPARAMMDLTIDVEDEDHYRYILNETFHPPSGRGYEGLPLVRLTVTGLDPTMVNLGRLAKDYPTVKTLWADSPEPPVLSSFSAEEVMETWKKFAMENRFPSDVLQLGQDALQAVTINQ